MHTVFEGISTVHVLQCTPHEGTSTSKFFNSQFFIFTANFGSRNISAQFLLLGKKNEYLFTCILGKLYTTSSTYKKLHIYAYHIYVLMTCLGIIL